MARLEAAARSLTASIWSRSGQPTRVELVYLPYYFFDVDVSSDAGSQPVGVAVDAVLGTTVFFIGDNLERKPGCDGATCEFLQPPDVARTTVMEEYRWLLLEHGLRDKRAVSIRGVSEPERVHYPFWVAYYKRRGAYDFKTVDAVSGEIQGVKMRKVFLAAFRRMAP